MTVSKLFANPDFEENSPGAFENRTTLHRRLCGEEMENGVAGSVNDGASEEEAAQQFIEDNPDLLESWTEGIGE
ncbi:hypothetical protein [Lentibacillus sp. CBA3610]|uniref:hypothetical protein n=1 Tax=Lentibacillus sp. CBA3610 TaxID=2518176 RepID=UPI0020D22149|nr:hypothetical protein [Lentibacillus sp. CBA3610]